MLSPSSCLNPVIALDGPAGSGATDKFTSTVLSRQPKQTTQPPPIKLTTPGPCVGLPMATMSEPPLPCLRQRSRAPPGRRCTENHGSHRRGSRPAPAVSVKRACLRQRVTRSLATNFAQGRKGPPHVKIRTATG